MPATFLQLASLTSRPLMGPTGRYLWRMLWSHACNETPVGNVVDLPHDHDASETAYSDRYAAILPLAAIVAGMPVTQADAWLELVNRNPTADGAHEVCGQCARAAYEMREADGVLVPTLTTGDDLVRHDGCTLTESDLVVLRAYLIRNVDRARGEITTSMRAAYVWLIAWCDAHIVWEVDPPATRPTPPRPAPRRRGQDGMYDYSARVQIQRAHVRPFRYYGVELEHEFGGDRQEYAQSVTAAHRGVLVKSDGSLNHGAETVSEPATMAEHHGTGDRPVDWAGILEAVRAFDGRRESTCGMHVHIDRRCMSRLTVGKLCVVLNSEDRTLRRAVRKIARRPHNRFCQVTPKANCAELPRSRYEAVNITNFGTVEVRIFASTVRPSRVLAAIEYCDSLVRYLPGCSVRNIETWELYENWLAKRPGEYPALVAYLRDDVRCLVQLDKFPASPVTALSAAETAEV